MEARLLCRINALERKLAALTLKIQQRPAQRANDPAKETMVGWDLETTGLGKTSEIRMWDIALHDGKQSVFQRYLNPGKPLSRGAQRVINMKEEKLATYDTWNDTFPDFNEFVVNSGPFLLVGFNSKRYDSRILMFESEKRASHRLQDEHLRFVDLMDIIKGLGATIDKPRTLGRYHEHFVGSFITSAHTASADAKAVMSIIDALNTKYGEHKVNDVIEQYVESVAGVRKRCFQ